VFDVVMVMAIWLFQDFSGAAITPLCFDGRSSFVVSSMHF
jgi:hypothetical protein